VRRRIIVALVFVVLVDLLLSCVTVPQSQSYNPEATRRLFELLRLSEPERIQAAINNGANVNARDHDGFTPLIVAAMYNPTPEVISTLVKARADLKAMDSDGRTALMVAARLNPNPEVIARLLQAGADVNAQDGNGDTALTSAAQSINSPEVIAEVISALLRAGANVNTKNNDGKTALEIVQNNEKLRNTNISQRIEEPILAFFTLVKTGTPKRVQVEISRGVAINARDKDGVTSLMVAALYNPDPEVIATLLTAGTELNARNEHGVTPLMYAAQFNPNPDVIARLLQAGADVNAQDGNGDTALTSAAQSTNSPEVIAEVISALLRAGANVNAKNNDGKTALEIVQSNEKLKNTNISQQIEERTQPQKLEAKGRGLVIENLSLSEVYPVLHAFYDTHPLAGC